MTARSPAHQWFLATSPGGGPDGAARLLATAMITFALWAGCGASNGGGGSGGVGASSTGGTTATGGRPGGAGSGGAPPSSQTGGTGMPAGSGGGGVPAGSGGPAPSGGAGGGPASGGAGGAATGDGLRRDTTCFPVCAFPTVTDPDGDGYGWERQATCLVATSPAGAGTTPCMVPPRPNLPAPGNGLQADAMCYPVCSSPVTDVMHTGFGYEHLMPCIVSGTAAAYGALPCAPNLPPLVPGDGIKVSDGTCFPVCRNLATAMPDAAGFGYENMMSCLVSTSVAALQGVPCDAPDPPAPPPPPPPPPGTGWNPDYTATMFGQANCAPFGFSDVTNLNGGTCVARGAVQLSGANTMFFGATGDLSTLWNGAPQCTCSGGQNLARCSSPPACSGQTNCGQCVEVTCNATGTHSFMGDGFTHNEFCKPGTSVVVQLIDTCPHNHPNNTYWCTTARPNHIDISCSAFNAIAQGRPIGEIGSINVYARPVNCNVGLGVKTF